MPVCQVFLPNACRRPFAKLVHVDGCHVGVRSLGCLELSRRDSALTHAGASSFSSIGALWILCWLLLASVDEDGPDSIGTTALCN